jgi:hypothetical protein
MDVAGSSGWDLSEPTTGSTVVALSMHLLQDPPKGSETSETSYQKKSYPTT